MCERAVARTADDMFTIGPVQVFLRGDVSSGVVCA